MKNPFKFLTVLVAIFSLTFTACDELEELADVDFISSLSGKYDLSFEAESEKTIEESMTINLADDSSISEYINKLKEIKITKITYEITNFTGDEYVDINVGLYMNSNTIVEPRDYHLETESDVEYEITDTAILETISTTLLNNKQVTFLLQGDYQSLPAATADIIVTVYFDATANPL